MAAFNSMIVRMLKFPMNIINQREELMMINNITWINGYDDKFLNRIYQRHIWKMAKTIRGSPSPTVTDRNPDSWLPGFASRIAPDFVPN
jgi:hypothetical protein